MTGAEYVPNEGPAIIAPNHKSFYDSFFIGLATRRHLHFMAKTELFEGKSRGSSPASAPFPSAAERPTPTRWRPLACTSNAVAASRRPR